MARPATGQVIVDKRRRSPSFGLRFRAYGRREYVALGSAAEGWTEAKAQTELQNVLADVRRGIWRPSTPEPAPEIDQDPTFHEFASRWFESTKGEWREKTQLDYEWQLSSHLLPFFKNHHLSQITIAEVDRYRQSKVAEAQAIRVTAAKGELLTDAYTDKRGRTRKRSRRALSVTSINKTITRLGQILEVAVEYGLIGANPAKGRRRRLKPQKAAPVWLDRAEHIEALLDAAGELDHHAKAKGGRDQKGGLVYRRALLSTLVFSGLRIGELTALQWRDVDLAGGRLTVRASKTDAGMRQVDLLPTLRDELAAYKAQTASIGPSAFVFTTEAGSELIQGNIRRRVLDKAVAVANEKLIESGEVPLPEGLTPHKLRHTFASILVALGVDPGSVMDQIGHTDPGFTLRVYRHGMRRDGAAKECLQALVGGAHWTTTGGREVQAPWSELTSVQRLGSSRYAGHQSCAMDAAMSPLDAATSGLQTEGGARVAEVVGPLSDDCEGFLRLGGN
jgi:integrase